MRYAYVITGLLAGLLTQCTVKTTTEEQPPKYPDSGSYCAGRAQAECNDAVIAACGASGKARCVASRQTVCLNAVQANALGKTFDPAEAEACVNAVGAAYTDAVLTKAEITGYNATCSQIFDGTGIKDGACQADTDCKQSAGLRCVLAAGTTSGTCQVPQIIAAGDTCATADALCTVDHHCGTTQHCDINADNGQACTAVLPCTAAFKCSTTGVCEAKLPDSTPCTTASECANGICAEGANLCTSQITLSLNEPFCISAR
jgi:hypothetical protein